MKHSERNAVLPDTGQSTGNDIDGDVSGTSIQAGSIGELHLADQRKPLWRKDFRYLVVPAAAVVGALALVALVLMELAAPGQPAKQAPAAATAEETAAAPSPVPIAGPPSASTTAGAPRPVPAGKPPRPGTNSPAAVPPTPTTASTATSPPPAATGVRFSGTLQFGSFHLDLAQPRNIPGTNVWSMPQNRLHGDDGYELAEWIADDVPGQAECAADLAKRATRDAENLILGSRVCGRTPGGRIFRIDVVSLDSTITGDVTVWS